MPTLKGLKELQRYNGVGDNWVSHHHSYEIVGDLPWRAVAYAKEASRRLLANAFGVAQLKLARYPHSLAASLTALPSMSLIPFTPFSEIAADLKR